MLASLKVSNLCLILFALTNQFYLMIFLLFISGLDESVVAVFILSSIQSVVPDDMMGKVMGLVGTVTWPSPHWPCYWRITGGNFLYNDPLQGMFFGQFPGVCAYIFHSISGQIC